MFVCRELVDMFASSLEDPVGCFCLEFLLLLLWIDGEWAC